MTGSWRRHHETSALVRTTRECGATPSPPVLDREPAGITRPVDHRAGDERPYDGSGRLQCRFADVAGAPFDADPRRGESRRGSPIRIVNAGGVAYNRAKAHPDAAPRANAHPYAVADAQPGFVADAETYLASDTHAHRHSNAHAHPNADPDPDTNSDAHSHANAHPDTYPCADANPDTNTHAYSDTHAYAYPGARRGYRDRRGQPDRSANFRGDRLIGKPQDDDNRERSVYLPDCGPWHLHADGQRHALHDKHPNG